MLARQLSLGSWLEVVNPTQSSVIMELTLMGLLDNARSTCLNQWNQDAFCKQLTRGQILWKFNAPGAPLFDRIWVELVSTCGKSIFAILANRSLALPVLKTKICVVKQTLNTRPPTPLSDDPEDLEAFAPNHILLREPVVAERLMPDSAKNIDCWKMHKVAQEYNQMIRNRWVKSIQVNGMCDANGSMTTSVIWKLKIW